MLAIVLAVLFGVIAFAALIEIRASVATGVRRGRVICAELSLADPRSGAFSRAAVRRPRQLASRLAAA